MIRNILKNAIHLGIGSAAMAKKATEDMISKLVEQNKISAKEGERLVKEWQSENHYRKSTIEKEIKGIIEKVLNRMRIPSRSDYELLEKRIKILEKKIAADSKNP